MRSSRCRTVFRPRAAAGAETERGDPTPPAERSAGGRRRRGERARRAVRSTFRCSPTTTTPTTKRWCSSTSTVRPRSARRPTVVFTPEPGFVGTVDFDYTICDASGAEGQCNRDRHDPVTRCSEPGAEGVAGRSDHRAGQLRRDRRVGQRRRPGAGRARHRPVHPGRPRRGRRGAPGVGVGAPRARVHPGGRIRGAGDVHATSRSTTCGAVGDDVRVVVEVAKDVTSATVPPIAEPDALRLRANASAAAGGDEQRPRPRRRQSSPSAVDRTRLPDELDVQDEGNDLRITLLRGDRPLIPFTYTVDDGMGHAGDRLGARRGDRRRRVESPTGRQPRPGQGRRRRGRDDHGRCQRRGPRRRQPLRRRRHAARQRDRHRSPRRRQPGAVHAVRPPRRRPGDRALHVHDHRRQPARGGRHGERHGASRAASRPAVRPGRLRHHVRQRAGDDRRAPQRRRPLRRHAAARLAEIGCGSAGPATVVSGRLVRFVPPPEQDGRFTCTYRVSNDQSGGTDDATITITVAQPPPQNQAPIANPDNSIVPSAKPRGSPCSRTTSIPTVTVRADAGVDEPVAVRRVCSASSRGTATRSSFHGRIDARPDVDRLRRRGSRRQSRARHPHRAGRRGDQHVAGRAARCRRRPVHEAAATRQRRRQRPRSRTAQNAELSIVGDAEAASPAVGSVSSYRADVITVEFDDDYEGVIVVEYTIADADGATAESRLELTVRRPANLAPTAGNDVAEVVAGETRSDPRAPQRHRPGADPAVGADRPRARSRARASERREPADRVPRGERRAAVSPTSGTR